MHTLLLALLGCSSSGLRSPDLEDSTGAGRTAAASLILSEIADLPDTTKFVEICNRGEASVSLEGVTLGRFANGNTEGTVRSLEPVVLAPGQAYVVSGLPGDLPIDQVLYNANGNGDDAYELAVAGQVVDRFGVVGVDGTSQPWEYTDTAFSRLESVPTGSAFWDAAQWEQAEPTPGDCGAPVVDTDTDTGDIEEPVSTEPGWCDDAEDLEGDALAAHLRALTSVSCGYDRSRRFLFGDLENVDGTVTCRYTGATAPAAYATYLPGINTEHLWPQSEGATGRARCDLNHLFPTDNDANGRRGTLPFGEVVEVDWQDGGSRRGEDANGYTVFEPPDDQKGDIARAIFYMHATYDLYMPAWYKDDLRAWNLADPPDAAERERSDRIAQEQGSGNPLVHCPSWVDRF